MEKMMGRLTALFAACLLLYMFTTPAMGWHPPCPPCHYWDGANCINECIPIFWCQDCVGGECKSRCDSLKCEECDGQGGCVDGCLLYKDCSRCDGNAKCESRCNPNNCEECVNDQCKVCGGNPDKVCCDGVCMYKCEDGEPTGQCDTSYNEECIGCTVFPYTCSDFKMREYYGNEVRYCTGGCPGDCVQQNAVECYVEYECKKGFAQFMRACGIAPDPNLILCGADIEGGGGGQDVACVSLPSECLLWYCSPCVKNNQEYEIEYAYPRVCQ